MPFVLGKKHLDISQETNLDYRAIALRHPEERARFRIQEGIGRSFRDWFTSQGFVEIHTPKIVSAGAEGGANIFRLDYFGREVCLAQSPQMYKQAMVGVFERVFEVGAVYRAEKHSTSRHLNEYIGLDIEMGAHHNLRGNHGAGSRMAGVHDGISQGNVRTGVVPDRGRAAGRVAGHSRHPVQRGEAAGGRDAASAGKAGKG
jgi:hypothetical protein